VSRFQLVADHSHTFEVKRLWQVVTELLECDFTAEHQARR